VTSSWYNHWAGIHKTARWDVRMGRIDQGSKQIVFEVCSLEFSSQVLILMVRNCRIDAL